MARAEAKQDPTSPVEMHASKKSCHSHRTKNFTIQEDECITRAWLAAREDVIVGTTHTGGTMWERILEAFNSSMGKVTDRTASGLQSRWQVIKGAVTRFCEFLLLVEKMNQNRANRADLISEARKMYANTQNAQFKFESCWLILKDVPKWSEHMLTKTTKNHKPSGVADLSGFVLGGSSNVETLALATQATPSSNPLDSDFDLLSPDQNMIPSPSNRKMEQERKKKSKTNSNDQSTVVLQEFLNIFQAAMKKQEEIALRQLQLKELSAQMRQSKEDDKIMGKDLSGLNPMQQQFFAARQNEIWERWHREGRFQRGPNVSEFGGSGGGQFGDGGI